MKATTSRWGMVTDPPLVALATSVGVIFLMAVLRLEVPPPVRALGWALAAGPLALASVVTLALSGARRRVVDWLAGLPFPVENMNALLNGVGDSLEIEFAEGVPATDALNVELDRVHPDAFVTKVVADARAVEVRIGVVDSKRNPARTNHERYERVRRIVDEVLVPLGARAPIRGVFVK
jgi:hypothetical protein